MKTNLDLARECGALLEGVTTNAMGLKNPPLVTFYHGELDAFARAIIAADRAQRQAVQEPVVWRYKNTESVVAAMAGYKPGADWGPLYAAPQPADSKGATHE